MFTLKPDYITIAETVHDHAQMAEFATPSAAAMSTMDAGADAPNGTSKPAVTKPEKPDEDAFKKAVEQARKALNDAQESSVRPEASTTL